MNDSQYPNAPGSWAKAPNTSKLAGESVADAAKNRSHLALGFIRSQAASGATADEVADAHEWERYSSRPRLAELHKRGVIVDSGRRRQGVSGRNQVVWVLASYGPDAEREPQGDLLAWLAA